MVGALFIPESGWAVPCQKKTAVLKSRLLAEKIASWLRQRDGDCFCDNCIASEMTEENPKDVHRMAMGLCRGIQAECNRFHAKCAVCGNAAIVTMARRNLGVA
jgi:hypothetical protein